MGKKKQTTNLRQHSQSCSRQSNYLTNYLSSAVLQFIETHGIGPCFCLKTLGSSICNLHKINYKPIACDIISPGKIWCVSPLHLIPRIDSLPAGSPQQCLTPDSSASVLPKRKETDWLNRLHLFDSVTFCGYSEI